MQIEEAIEIIWENKLFQERGMNQCYHIGTFKCTKCGEKDLYHVKELNPNPDGSFREGCIAALNREGLEEDLKYLLF